MSNRISLRELKSSMGLGTEQLRNSGDFDVGKAGIARRLLADIAELTPVIASRAPEFETLRCIPDDVMDVLKSIGVFSMFVPQSHGGLELDLPSGLEIVTALAKLDGSLGWTAMIGSGAHLLPALLPRQTYDRYYDDGRDMVIAVVAQPAGTAEAADGGWRVNGRWPFASASPHADLIGAFCIMTEGGRRPVAPAGAEAPLIRGFFMPARDWQIEDTWHATGLKGSASHHIVMKDKVVPPECFFDIERSAQALPGPLYQTVQEFLPLFHGAFAIGMARGALDELVQLAGRGHQQQRIAVPMRESEIFQAELGRVAADVRAAESYQQVQAEIQWRRALAGTLKDEPSLDEATRAGVWVTATCLRAVDACFGLAGGSAVYETSPLQRRLRDMHAAAQHAFIHPRNYVGSGKLLLRASA
ncbi:MAG: acyl-CoA dehydrogenase family protein [Reyranella sp.]|uniref:acyl-CoA dehydrogenase family protein n=1 Tax=Reyranella sp. TaxID=1929291 RepID=UPI003D13DD82